MSEREKESQSEGLTVYLFYLSFHEGKRVHESISGVLDSVTHFTNLQVLNSAEFTKNMNMHLLNSLLHIID